MRLQEEAFEQPFLVSYVTLAELENIKTAKNKDEDVKHQARKVTRLLMEKMGVWEAVMADSRDAAVLQDAGLEATPDNLIIAGLCRYTAMGKDIQFYTDDLLCYLTAVKHVGKKNVCAPWQERKRADYFGWVDTCPTDDTLTAVYQNNGASNPLSLQRNEYAILRDEEGACLDIVKWTGESTKRVAVKPFKSRLMGEIKPKDEWQRCAFDALTNAEMVVLSGRSGTGKTSLALAYLMQQVEQQRIRKLYIVAHHEPLKGSRALGFLPGAKLAKQLQTGSLGNVLTSKLGGDAGAIHDLIANGQIEIISTGDIRGWEAGSEDAVFVTECEDLDAYTLMTLIQRCKEGCKQIYEGDMRQVDIRRESGFPKLVDVFRGNSKFACVKLKRDYRSPLGILADKLCE